MSKRAQLAQLAEQVRQLCRDGKEPAQRCASGLPELDAALGGGFVAGAVHEFLTCHDGAAAHSVALLTAANAAGRHGWILYVDTTGDFYPPGAARLGVSLGRLLIIRTPRHADVLWVGEQALRCRGVAAVVLPSQHIDAYASRRLQLAAEAGGGLGLLIRKGVDSPVRKHGQADTGPDRAGAGHERTGGRHVQAERGFGSPGHTFAASRLRFDPLVGDTDARRLLVTVLKLREGRPLEPFVVELPDAAGVVPAHAVPLDRPGTPRRSAAAG